MLYGLDAAELVLDLESVVEVNKERRESPSERIAVINIDYGVIYAHRNGTDYLAADDHAEYREYHNVPRTAEAPRCAREEGVEGLEDIEGHHDPYHRNAVADRLGIRGEYLYVYIGEGIDRDAQRRYHDEVHDKTIPNPLEGTVKLSRTVILADKGRHRQSQRLRCQADDRVDLFCRTGTGHGRRAEAVEVSLHKEVRCRYKAGLDGGGKAEVDDLEQQPTVYLEGLQRRIPVLPTPAAR